MFDKKLADLDASDIVRLVLDEVPEGRQLEYKRTLPGNTDADHKEFLADVTALANSAGGYIVYGVEDRRDERGRSTGLPARIVGLPSTKGDYEILRLSNMIRNGVEPRMFGVELRLIDPFEPSEHVVGGPVLVIRIPQSFAAPHMVMYKTTSRFYARTSAGKHALDVHEIRAAFALSESLPQRIREFRAERIARVLGSEGNGRLGPMRTVVLHLIPLAAFRPDHRFDLLGAAASPRAPLSATAPGGLTHSYNFDGHVIEFGSPDGSKPWAYDQLFRNGSIESASTSFVESERFDAEPFGAALLAFLDRTLEFYRAVDVDPPLFAMLSLLGFEQLAFGNGSGDPSPRRFDRSVYLMPELLIESFDANLPALLRPTLDHLWQIVGHSRCSLYDDLGQWRGRE